MASEGERIKREIRAIKEVVAVKKNMSKTGDWQNITQTHLETCVPPEYQYLEELEEDALETRKKRLEADLEDLERRKDACEFNRDVELHRGRRINEEDGDGE
ncbi:uncharacterized protein Nmlp_1266 [Natronomonas moolapensis 8.8.11]|uniref:Uncharacterized protein n=1 Tax=Natronomonas moolapensis (strain DSM 18674 / CECT 7526 / JCM 14361 / 8.8.11) TaxID=268739 RepID=M1XZ99_NATM8|nr:hypothetical protein [Natronomonas moolapensis]CCQ35475.1 uncharacterized protein Nmlp_1266 [Natronomonas moolapensis 8.8.11]